MTVKITDVPVQEEIFERVVIQQDGSITSVKEDSMELGNGGRRKSLSGIKAGERFIERIDSRVIAAIVLWYFWSGCTLFLNKYMIDLTDGDATILSCIQMCAALVLGMIQRRHSFGLYPVDAVPNHVSVLSKDVIIIGGLRFMTVFLGLYALKYVEVSFTETVKSTAPAFTLVLSSLLLGEKTTLMMKLSTIPVMAGLAICSASEAKFNIDGFFFALSTNLSECLQNVLSKKMLSMQKVKLNPGEIQYITAVTSLFAQIPTLIFFAQPEGWHDLLTFDRAVIYLFNGICFHFQTLSGYALMDAVSPVTHSVANTLKRALLIWASVMIFKNTVTLLSGIGTTIVFIGVLLYNRARK